MSPWCKRLVYHPSPAGAVRCDDSPSEQIETHNDGGERGMFMAGQKMRE